MAMKAAGHVGRQLVEVDRRRVLAAAHGDQGAGAVEIGDRGLALDVVELGGVGQVAAKTAKKATRKISAPDAQHQRPVDEGLQRACARAGLAGSRPPLPGGCALAMLLVVLRSCEAAPTRRDP